jgi:4-amino-4-deoxy-L-arabinose transferase-like glycosyltransferase/tetratricopeptide (TPR) repeat protein
VEGSPIAQSPDGPTAASTLGRSRALALAVGLLLLWIYTHNIATNPLKWEEPRRCLVAMEMIYRGDFVVPRVLGELYLNKPPLHNWALVLFSGVDYSRVGPLSTRLLTLTALAGIALFLWRLGSGRPGNPPDPLPALIFVTTGTIFQFGRAGEIDIFFCLVTTAALACFELGRRRRAPILQWCLPQVLVAAGVLTKGFAPIFFYPPVLWFAWRRRGEVRFSAGWFLLGAVLAGLLVSLWMVPYSELASLGDLQSRWGDEVRILTTAHGPAGLLRHVATYPLLLLGVSLPWSLALFGAGPAARAGARRSIASEPWLAFAATVVGWGALVYLLVPGTDGRYLMPLLPFSSALLASLLRGAAPSAPLGRRGVQAGVFCLLALVVVAYTWSWGRELGDGRRIEAWLTAAIGLATPAAFWVAGRRGGLGPASTLLAIGLVHGVMTAGVWEARRAERGVPLVAAGRELARAVDPAHPVVTTWTNGTGRQLAYAMSQAIGRPLWAHPPQEARREWYHLLAPDAALPPPGPTLLAESGGYSLWRFEPWETLSFDGRPLFAPPLPRRTRIVYERRLSEARVDLRRRDYDETSLIWVGRRTAYLGRYREAVAMFTYGLSLHPESHKLRRHRGHRFITLRRLDDAVRDLEEAAARIAELPDEVEPDGLPNPQGVPRSTSHTNIWYHLGLAHYLSGDLAAAERCYARCLGLAGNDDMDVAARHWLYMILRRRGRAADAERLLAPVREQMEIFENESYHRLLLMYQGREDPERLLADALAGGGLDAATVGYGVGNWYRYTGRPSRAREIYRAVLAGPTWAAFGYIAAEAELSRGEWAPQEPSAPARAGDVRVP